MDGGPRSIEFIGAFSGHLGNFYDVMDPYSAASTIVIVPVIDGVTDGPWMPIMTWAGGGVVTTD